VGNQAGELSYNTFIFNKFRSPARGEAKSPLRQVERPISRLPSFQIQLRILRVNELPLGFAWQLKRILPNRKRTREGLVAKVNQGGTVSTVDGMGHESGEFGYSRLNGQQ
jgi:hypothetical protein